MISQRRCRLLFCLLVISGSVLYRCSPGDGIAAGSGSTTTNGFTATIINGDGTPVVHATVHIRSTEYCATAGGSEPLIGTAADTSTGDDGSFTVGEMEPGNYTIEAFDTATGQGSVVRGSIIAGPVQDIGSLTVAPVGVIRGALDVELLDPSVQYAVQVYGMERFARVDSATGTFSLPGMPPAKYKLRLVSINTTFDPVDFDTVNVGSDDTVSVNPYAAWKHAADLHISPAAAGLSAGDTVLDFPLLLRLDNSNFDFSTERKKGNGFRVAKEDGSAVPFEHEWWDSANGTAALWLHIDTLFGNRQTQVLRLYWGNAESSLRSELSVVFDTAFGFEGVWHLNESGGTEQEDATSNNRIGVPYAMDGANDIPGIIGRSQEFEEDSQYILFGPTLEGRTGGDTGFTVSFWAKAAGVPAEAQGVFSLSDAGYGVYLGSDSRWGLYDSAPGFDNDSCFGPATVGQWDFLCCVRRGDRNILYVNGVAVDSCIAHASGSTAGFSDISFQLGGFASYSGWFYGVIDEFRIYRVGLSDRRIRLCYATQREGQEAVTIVNR